MERLISKLEFAERLQRSPRSLPRLEGLPGFPQRRYLNGRPYWLESEVDTFLQSLPTEPEPSKIESMKRARELRRRKGS